MNDIQALKEDDIYLKEYWLDLCPDMHIEEPGFISSKNTFNINNQLRTVLTRRIVLEGYFDLFVKQWDLNLKDMAGAVSLLVENGVPAPFAFLFDEFWALFIKLDQILCSILGDGYFRLPDFWVWHVDPLKRQCGWAPHRDKVGSINTDGTPKSLTCWIPLTNATSLNSCIYVVPADKDKNYQTPDKDSYNFSLSDIRALPGAAGTILMWNQQILHWGSSTSERANNPRISVAFEFQRGDVKPFNTPISRPMDIPNFRSRLKLVAKQVLQYQHMYTLDINIKRLSNKILAIR